MKKILLTGLLCLSLPLTVLADNTKTDTQTPVKSAHTWHKLTPEEQKAFHEKMTKRWQEMTPEAKAQLQQRMRTKWQEASPEQRAVMRERLIMKFKSMTPEEQKQVLSALNKANN